MVIDPSLSEVLPPVIVRPSTTVDVSTNPLTVITVLVSLASITVVATTDESVGSVLESTTCLPSSSLPS